MNSSTAVGRCLRTVFGHLPGTKTNRQERRLRTTEAAKEDSKNKTDEEDVEKVVKDNDDDDDDDDDDDCGEDERRDDEFLGEDVSLLSHIPVDRKNIAQRVHRAISKPFLHETNLTGGDRGGGGCGDGSSWSVYTYTDHRSSAVDQPCTTTSDLTPKCLRETPVQSEGNLSEASDRSSDHPDEWNDYTDDQWNLLLASCDQYERPCRLAVPAASAAAAAGGGCGRRLTAVNSPSAAVSPTVEGRRTSGFLSKQTSFSRLESFESDQTDSSRNLIDFDSEDQETLVRRF